RFIGPKHEIEKRVLHMKVVCRVKINRGLQRRTTGVLRLGRALLVLSAAVLYPMTVGQSLLDASDQRVEKLEKFFKAYSCPQPYYIDRYLRSADDHLIDYRLLPAISVRESTCGQYDHRNNRWGWDSARTGFKSVENGIDFISEQLADGDYYRGKSTDDKIY